MFWKRLARKWRNQVGLGMRYETHCVHIGKVRLSRIKVQLQKPIGHLIVEDMELYITLTKLNGVVPSALTLFHHTHRRKDHTWVDRRSEHITTKIANEIQEMTQRASEQGTPLPDELDVWHNVAGVKKGKIYGLGSESTVVAGRPQYRDSSSSSFDWVRRDELEELRRERNELWA